MSRVARTLAFLFALHDSVVAQKTAPPEAPSLEHGQSSVHSKQATIDPDFAEARRLMQQGKVDDAIAELQTLDTSTIRDLIWNSAPLSTRKATM